MESFGGYGFSAGACVVRKKRSVVSHKPRLDPLTFSERSKILLRIVHHDSKETRPKKLKLKLRGVTHTIQAKHTVDSSGGSGSSVPNSSGPSDDFIPQSEPLFQDDKPFCSSDGGKGVGVKRKYSLKLDSTSSKGKMSRESVPEDGEPARKSKRIPKRRVLDVGLSEDGNEDDEIQFLERLNASKRNQINGDNGSDIGNRNLPKLRKHGGLKSSSEKMYKDKDYLGEEEELTSDDELESNGKTLKRGSLSLLLGGPKKSAPTTRNRALQSGIDILTGSGSSNVNLANHSAPSRIFLLVGSPQKRRKSPKWISNQRKLRLHRDGKYKQRSWLEKLRLRQSERYLVKIRRRRRGKKNRSRREMSHRGEISVLSHWHHTLSDGIMVLMERLLHSLMILVCRTFSLQCPAVTLPHVKNVPVQTVQMHTSIGIPSPSFPFAVSSVTRHCTERLSL